MQREENYMKTYTYVTNSRDETHALGASLGRNVKPSMVFLMKGDLGAGKTTLTQGIAKGLEIKKTVTSPTFNILKIYKGRLPLYHIDAYRMEGVSQDLGFDEFLDYDGLTVIEWSQFMSDLIPDEYMSISISLMEGDARRFEFEAVGHQYEELLEVLSK